MQNINPAPSQNNYNQPLVGNSNPNLQIPNVQTPNPQTPNSQTPVAPPPIPVIRETIKVSKASDASNTSNKLWIIFLVLVAILVGFWLGYFTNDYFYKTAEKERQALQSAIDYQTEDYLIPESDLIEVEKSYINFRGEWSYIGDALNFTSDQECVADEIVMLTAIDDDFVTIEIKHPVLQEETGEYVMEVGEYQVRGQECLVAESSCVGTNIDRCFSLENIDGVWHLDYNLIENTTLEGTEVVEVGEAAEVVVPVQTAAPVEAEI